ncbi:MAG: hypothetical protein F4087_14500 [Gemmatimonadetes bacterium]|nr:hypothetical protein [Gemmatimonadota bacterium]MDE2678488.1 hypothetical protein [Gemmatimonadota bacterium]MXX34030.1 hypothetical protein [Gemmatimonadota bacterium]MYA12545.1 hypothetical protein [Gemmatimonadota bacterium]MYD13928.1 hypothetical protein [Gemmatimonadota bacterium]
MTRLVRITGFLLIGAGALVLLTWAIRPLRAIWPLLLGLPLAIQIGMGIAALGLVVVMGSLIAERIEDREADRRLLEDRPESSRSQ